MRIWSIGGRLWKTSTRIWKKITALDLEELENVSGGLKWGPERLSGQGPRKGGFWLSGERNLAEEKAKEAIGSSETLSIAEELKKRGGFV